MKILPDYLIEYIPYIEEALEELRLSVLDHAYELLKSLDIDELTTDDIRHKLELYDIKVENMTDAWLPNGRFYRMYPSIKHNRTRKNDLVSIAQSGGQFEGVWSSDFNTKDKYNFKTISVARHYEMGSYLDGYFYISGDTSRNKDGSIKNSAIKALQTDILMASALPAGYTYLYVPWPRPHYPDDSTYFYNVHMLDYDRLAYASDCSHAWYKLADNLYYCPDNSSDNKYCKFDEETGKDTYSSDKDSEVWSDFTDNDNDRRWFDVFSTLAPVSMRYDWYNGSNTSFRTPYWFDYHYMNTLNHTEDSYGKSLTWPITESGKYYGINDDGDYYEIENPTNDILYSDAVKYEPDQKELYSQYEYDDKGKRKPFEWSVFPTVCYSHARYRTSEPNRLQSFYTYDNKYSAVLSHCSDNSPETIRAIAANLANITVDEAYRIINNLPYVIGYNLSKNVVNVIKEVFEHLITKIIVTSLIDPSMLSDFKSELMSIYDLDDSSVDQLVANFPDEPLVLLSPINKGLIEVYPELQPYCNMTMISVDCVIEIHDYKTIDENCTTDITNKCKQEPSAYRHDLLLKDVCIIHENIHHIKTFKPVWSEESPVFAMLQSSFNSNLSDDTAKNSLKYWTSIKQQENRPQLLSSNDLVIPEYESIVRDNEPPVSAETFTSFDRPTIGKLDPVYVGYTMYGSDQGIDGLGDTPASNLSSTISDNVLYKYGAVSTDDYIEYDPSLFYTLVSLNEVSGTQPSDSSIGQEYYDESENPFKAYIIGGPSTGKLYINRNGDDTHGNQHNYATYKTSKIHKLWLTNDHIDIPVASSYNLLFNSTGNSDVYYYTENNKSFIYNIIGYYDSHDRPVSYNTDASLECLRINLGGNYEYAVSSSSVGNADGYEMEHVVNHVTETVGNVYYNLNNNWEATNEDDTSITSLLDNSYTFYRSFSNHGQPDSNAVFIISVTAYKNTTLHYKVAQDSEYDYDYIKVFIDRTDIDSNNPDYSFRNLQGWSSLDIPISPGDHTIRIIYHKDSDTDDGNDRGYIAIKSDEIDTSTMSFTYIREYDTEYDVKRYINFVPIEVAYVLFTLKVVDGSVEDASFTRVFVHVDGGNPEYIAAEYIAEAQLIKINGSYISVSDLPEGYSLNGSGDIDTTTSTVSLTETANHTTVLYFNDTNNLCE